MPNFIKEFKDLSKNNVDIAGGKGASLGEMTRSKIPVPPGFVILAGAFDRFLKETDLLQAVQAELNKVNYDDVNSVDHASSVIRDLIHDAPMPKDLNEEILKDYHALSSTPTSPRPLPAGRQAFARAGEGVGGYVAVRSSATAEDSSIASWAGELESYLDTTEKSLLLNVKNCWSSLFTPRAIFYRKEKNLLKTKISVAVVVQVMVESEISGICFTVHPVTEDKNQMIIEAGFGLGEAIVSGSITPDSYVLDKRDWSLMDVNISEQERKIIRQAGVKGGVKWVPVPKPERGQQKLSGKQIVELAKICGTIEKHYKHPQDIEWAFAKGKFYITQSRPITTL